MKKLFFCIFLITTISSCKDHHKKEKATVQLYDYDVEQRITELGIELHPPELPPGLKIKLAKRVDNLVYLSGNGPISHDGERTVGKVGTDLTVEQGYQAARLTAINHLSILKEEIGDLNKVVSIVKVLGMVNCNAAFENHPQVINGYSDLLLEVFGERGSHARSAVGMGSLPWNLACEVETIVEVRD
jgi:enamine deaminase RidA (YjgF/YER057c/UK114 family)